MRQPPRKRQQSPQQVRAPLGVGPRFALERVWAAAAKNRVHLGQSRCQDPLMPLIGSLLGCRKFAADVLGVLRARDFSRTIRLGNLECDVYGVELPRRLVQQYGLGPHRTWYVKLSLQTDEEDSVLLISLHGLERAMNRQGGRLKPVG